MITLHYLDNSRAHRVLWLLEELQLPYRIKRYSREADMRAPKTLKAVHPLGKSPVIDDDGLAVAESGAIIEYLLGKYGEAGLVPPVGTPDRDRYRYWLHYAEGSAMPLIVMKLVFSRLPSQVPGFLKPFAGMIARGAAKKLIDPQMQDHIGFWNTELGRDGWFAGKTFSAADIAMSFPVESGMRRVEYDGETTAIKQFLAAIRARPAYQRAVEKGGAYMFADTEVA
jgi:glutathione S-transferase